MLNAIAGGKRARYLLVLGSTDVGSISIGASAGNVTELAAELILSVASQNAAAAPAAATAALGDLQRRLLLLVLLAFEMLLVRLRQKTTDSAQGKYARAANGWRGGPTWGPAQLILQTSQ